MMCFMFRRFRPLLIAALLLAAQQAGIAHLSAHAAARLREAPVPAQGENHDCAQCLQFASLASAVPVAMSVPPVIRAPVDRFVELPASAPASIAAPGYRSRAPPSTT
jgi:hypothetical protein